MVGFSHQSDEIIASMERVRMKQLSRYTGLIPSSSKSFVFDDALVGF